MDDFEKAMTLFSSEGEIKDVEHARIGVRRSLPSAGVKTGNGLVLGTVTKSSSSPLLEEDVVGSAYMIGNNVGMVSSGRVADAQEIVEEMRDTAMEDIEKYGRVEDVNVICNSVAERVREATQRVMQRPYGVSMIVGGINGDGSHSLYRIDVDGRVTSWSAVSVGQKEDEIMNYLEENYDEDLSRDEILDLTVNSLDHGVEDAKDEDFSIVEFRENGLENIPEDQINEIRGD